ncbi:MAG: CPBP family intramembrane metalloprotease, partial [Acidobacteria bacterium]|nr:CPBP family intramembrane metalloprotease [Acidobacteriota bacterium]
MRERLTRSDLRFLIACLLLLGGSVWFSAKFFYRAFPEASIDFAVTRDQARGLAERFVAAQGQSLGGYRQASRFAFDDRAKTFLERELGLDQANRIMGARVRLWHWSYRWFRPLQKEEYRVDITPRGETVGYRRLIEEAAAGASLSADRARAAAEDFLRTRMQRDPAGLEAVDTVSTVRPARVDHVFTWKERDFSVKDATYRVEVTVAGDQVAGYREYLKIPETWVRDYDRLRSRNEVAQMVDTALMVLLALGALVTLLIRIGSRDVRWGRAAAFAGTGAALILLSGWNAYPLAEFGYPTTDSYGSFLASRLMLTLASALGGGAFIFALTAAAEPLYRQWFGPQISLGNLFRRRGLRTKRFFLGTMLGLALTGIFVAYQTAFYLVAYRFGAWSPADVPYSDLLNTRLPWLFVLLGGFLPAVGEEFLFRMFAIPFLRRLFRFTWLAVVLAGFLWGFGHSSYPQQPFYIRGVEVGIGGVVLGLVMLRWGILPTLVWHYSVDALYTALLLLRSHNLYFILSGAASAGVMVLPLLAAWIAYLRGGGFEPAAEITNEHEGTAAPAAERAAPVVVEAELPYAAWSSRRRLAGLLLLAALAAFLLLPVKRFGDFSSFAVNAARALTAADGFLREQGMDPRSFRSVVYVENEFSRPSSCCGPGARDVGKYFLERRSPSYLKDVCLRLVPLHTWNVRYYRPLEKEDLRVTLHPETGQVVGFLHGLPEDRPGAELPPAAAQKIAADYLSARGFDLSTFELKETTSEKRKARQDYTLVWEAKAGDPRNIGEAYYRVRVQVAGDRVVALRTLWKLPETFMRERNRTNALEITHIGLLVGSIAALVMAGLYVLVQQTRKRQLRWRSAIAVSLVVTSLAALGALSRFPLMFRT